MKFKEIHQGIVFDEKEFKMQKRIFKGLIKDLENAVKKYDNRSLVGYTISLMGEKDIQHWNTIGNPNKSDFYWQILPGLGTISLALSYRLIPIPVEDLQ